MARAAALGDDDASLLDPPDRVASDLLAKCEDFTRAVAGLARGIRSLYHVPIRGPLDHRVTVAGDEPDAERSLICFDSNSYLGLHRHPRVIEATVAAVRRLGYGTPSAQILGGTSRELGELEATLAAFHHRPAAMVFPSGYAANLGVVTALLGPHDVVLRDRYCHASLHDGARAARCRRSLAYPHRDGAALARALEQVAGEAPGGKLLLTDGVFSMHGTLADLPALVRLRDRFGARLLVDDAHGVGVLGATGRGIEEHHGIMGGADVLVGTFSKAPGTVGGYVAGSAAVIEYLRFHARAGFFTAAFPAALAVGVTEAFRVIEAEPELRAALWRNVHRLHAGLSAAGLPVSPAESPILTVFAGHTRLLWALGRALFEAGVKTSSVDYPAVPRGEALLRLSVNARHTAEDLDRTVEISRAVGARFGLLGRTREEILELATEEEAR